MIQKGDRVKLSDNYKKALRECGNLEHFEEFGNCTGIVEGPVSWGPNIKGPELEVRWLPSKLRYAYLPKNLIKVT